MRSEIGFSLAIAGQPLFSNILEIAVSRAWSLFAVLLAILGSRNPSNKSVIGLSLSTILIKSAISGSLSCRCPSTDVISSNHAQKSDKADFAVGGTCQWSYFLNLHPNILLLIMEAQPSVQLGNSHCPDLTMQLVHLQWVQWMSGLQQVLFSLVIVQLQAASDSGHPQRKSD